MPEPAPAPSAGQRKALIQKIHQTNSAVAATQERMHQELRRVTAERREAIHAANEAGISKNDIAAELGVSPQRLRMVLKGGPR